MGHENCQMTVPTRPTGRGDPPVDAASVLILVVDDEVPIATMITAVVEDLGYQTRVAAHGRDALDLARASWPALVITDLMMPELNGAALIAALRAEATTQGYGQVPVILMTAAGLEPARRAGADAVLSKPFDLDELERLITRFLLGPRQGKQNDTPAAARASRA